MVVGKLVETAARTLQQTLVDAGLLGAGGTGDAFIHACRTLHRHTRCAAGIERIYSPPPGVQWDDETYRGDAYGAFAWAVYVAEVSVDTATWETRIDDFVAAAGSRPCASTRFWRQARSKAASRRRSAMRSSKKWSGATAAWPTAQMTNYIMPTSMDLPPIRVFFEERPYAHGPRGAKGIGELPMDGAGAGHLRTRSRTPRAPRRTIPITPESLMAR